jgi:hypothetical protein
MKKMFLGLVAASVLMACNQAPKADNTTTAATTAVNTTNAPVMKFADVTHDFGKIKQGDKTSYDFKFTNTGKSPLIVTNAVASCGCTTPEWPKEPVLPGKDGKISVTFNSAGKSGLQDKQITITANTNPAQNVVHLIGEVLTK